MKRDEQISILEMVTQFSFEYLKSLNDEALERLYKERVEDR